MDKYIWKTLKVYPNRGIHWTYLIITGSKKPYRKEPC